MRKMRFFSCVIVALCLLSVLVDGGGLSDIANKVAETASSFGDKVHGAAANAGEQLLSVQNSIGTGLTGLKNQLTNDVGALQTAATNEFNTLDSKIQEAISNRTNQLAAKKDILLTNVDPTFQPIAKSILDQLQNGTSLTDIIAFYKL